MPNSGFTAARTDGAPASAIRPNPPRAMNHRTMTGPNVQATRSVPRVWNEKRQMAISPANIIRNVWGVCSNPGIKRIPSTAERMLMAGVMTPSPMKREIPTIARKEIRATWLPDLRRGSSVSLRTMVPPSPFFPMCMAR
ncbi:MAG: hypothetical protein A4E34_00870 [Methanoregula sp. PtaU1.Bin006]|nr:MAG: hypothetical protein A4E34_00870 [Methanoregula sp. PtaU1.Bin006]